MNRTAARDASLPRNCSPGTPARDPREVVFRGPTATIGRFRCDARHPEFRDSGPARHALVVFPRSSVWIRHEGARAFVADPNVITLYNRGQRYERLPISSEGDQCDWFALSEEAAREVAAAWTPAAADAIAGPYPHARAPGTARLYARQRALLRRASAADATALEIEEETLGVVSEVMRLAAGASPRAMATDAAGARHRDLTESARELLALTALENRSVSELARQLGTSPFHLCRVYRAQTGVTLHQYRVGLRVRAAITHLEAPVRGARRGLSAVAHAAGFASHAHFVRICRRELGLTPAALRDRLG